MAIIDDLKDYYANLLIVQYNGKPKATATIKMLVDLIYANCALLQIQDAFNWRTAVGKQLDIIGKWVGVDRKITKNLYDEHNWFSLIEVTGAISQYQGGFSEVSNFGDNDGGFLTPDLVPTYFVDLTDENFRFLIGLKIIKNSISCTCKNIDDAIHDYNEQIYTSWNTTNRTLTYNFPTTYKEIMEVAQVKNVLPCPPTSRIILRGE